VGGRSATADHKSLRCTGCNIESMATPTPSLPRQSAGLAARRGRGKKKEVGAINETSGSTSAKAGMTEVKKWNVTERSGASGLVEIPAEGLAHGLGHHAHMGVDWVVEADDDPFARLLEAGDLG